MEYPPFPLEANTLVEFHKRTHKPENEMRSKSTEYPFTTPLYIYIHNGTTVTELTYHSKNNCDNMIPGDSYVLCENQRNDRIALIQTRTLKLRALRSLAKLIRPLKYPYKRVANQSDTNVKENTCDSEWHDW